MEALFHDLRYAFRQLRRSPGFTFIWTFTIEHSGEHYGQLVVYYRANNLVPPDSRR